VTTGDERASWAGAADRFWAVLAAMPGAPGSLRVVDLDSGEERLLGEGAGYEIHGRPEALLNVLEGRTSLIDAAFEQSVYIRGTFAELSVLTGACFAIAEEGDGDG
jgi:hypothetical protein